MVLSVVTFDKKNNANLVQNSLKLTEELIDKDIVNYHGLKSVACK